jgi:hypothetical protein
MAVGLRGEVQNKFLVPHFPSTGALGFAKSGDMVYKSSDLYATCSTVAGSTLGTILGVCEIVSTSTASLGYIRPVSGQQLEIDFSTDWSTSVVSTTNIGRLFAIGISTTYGSVLDLSTTPVKDITPGSTEVIGSSTNKECFMLTGFSTNDRKAFGFIPNRFLYI